MGKKFKIIKHAFMLAVAKRPRPLLILLFWSSVNSVIMSVLNPLSIQLLIDEGVVNKNLNLFILVGLGSIIVFSLLRISEYYCVLRLNKFEFQLANQHLETTIESFKSRDDLKQIEKESGYLLSRTLDDSFDVSRKFIRLCINLTKTLSACLASFSMILYLSLPLSLILVTIAPILYHVAQRFGKKIKLHNDLELESEAVLKGDLTSHLNALSTINILAYWQDVKLSIQERFNSYQNDYYNRFKAVTTFSTINQIILSWLELIVIIASGFVVFLGKMTFGGFSGYLNAFWITIHNFRALTQTIPEFAELTSVLERINQTRDSGNSEGILHSRKDDETKDIILKDIHFSYDDRKHLLQGINLTIPQGKSLLIEGANGSGKSTLAQIIAGYLKPTQGCVKTPKRIVAFIEPVAFPKLPLHLLIKSNIKQFYEIAQKLQLDIAPTSFFDDLSFGQKKKFVVAKSLSTIADCYIFDEPNSGLDDHTNQLIIRTILSICNAKKKTVVIIAHQASSLRNYFDECIYLDNLNVSMAEVV